MPISAQNMSNRPNLCLNESDSLSLVLSRLELCAEVYVDGNFCGAWAVDTSGSRRIPFHLIGSGKAWLHMEGQQSRLLSAGDLVVFPHDHHHVIASSEEQPDETIINAEIVSSGENSTNLVCGFFEFKHKAAWPLLDSLPEMITLALAEQSYNPEVRMIIEFMMRELRQEKAGYYAVVNQLAYLLFIQIIRQQIDAGKLDSGLLVAMFDEKIGRALACIHAKPQFSWSLQSLADEAAMGRSSFAARFNQLVGMSVMQYLTAWRMQEAKHLLVNSDDSIIRIAEACGYESEAAFRKVYKKITGETPGNTRRVGKPGSF